MRFPVRWLAAVALLAPAACSDSTDSGPPAPAPPGTTRSESELTFLRFGDNIADVPVASISFWARTDDDRSVELEYERADGNEVELLQFSVPQGALLARPGGAPFGVVDSVLITIRVTNPTARRFEFTFEPAGLRFSPSRPARLAIEYDDCDDDQKRTAEPAFGLWRAEQGSTLFTRESSLQDDDLDELELDVLGFTRYAVAY